MRKLQVSRLCRFVALGTVTLVGATVIILLGFVITILVIIAIFAHFHGFD